MGVVHGVVDEVVPGVFRIKERSLVRLYRPEVNVFVIAGPDGVVFDAGYGDPFSRRLFRKAIRTIGRICHSRGQSFHINRILVSHSHADHFSGLKYMRSFLKARILLTARTAAIIRDAQSYISSYSGYNDPFYTDLPYVRGTDLRDMDRPGLLRRTVKIISRLIYAWFYGVRFVDDPDEIIKEDGELLINGEIWRLIPSPGHTGDHALLHNPARGILFSGDNVLEGVTTWLGPPESDIGVYLESLENMFALEKLEIVLGSHGDPIREPYKRIRDIIEIRNARIVQILDLVRKRATGITVNGILHHLYSGDSGKNIAARGMVIISLMNLEKRGLVRREEGRAEAVFFPSRVE